MPQVLSVQQGLLDHQLLVRLDLLVQLDRQVDQQGLQDLQDRLVDLKDQLVQQECQVLEVYRVI